MEGMNIAKLMARWAALGSLFLIPFAPLIVADSYFFPFITGKAFYLRILIEIAVAGWIVLAFLDKEYRPRFSWIGAAVVGFVVWMGIADAFALNALKAFWSNFERMEGWILLIHLLGFFYAAGAVLRVEKKWRAWFLTSLGVAVIISGYVFLQINGSLAIHQGSTRVDATLGNSAYLAIYLLFSSMVALWLALTEQRSWLKWLLIALSVLEAVLIFFTETRGTIIGLVLALLIAAVLTAVTAGKRARGYAAGACALILIVVGGFYLARNSDFVQDNHVLQRVATISLSSLQTRLTLWQMAVEGMQENPVLGWGQEGFNYVFNKYYDPSLFTQEQWFDRAHSAFIDWLTAGGIPAFLLYISLFGSAIFLLWTRTELSRPERIVLTATLIGYAVHNMLVFDNLYSYIYFFAILALIDSQVARPIAWFERTPEVAEAQGVTYVLPITVVVLCAALWFVNGTGMRTASNLIIALSPTDSVQKNIDVFEEFAAHPNFAMQEIREQLVSFASAVVQSPALTNEQKQKVAALAISEMQKQIKAYPEDAREYIQLSYAYRTVGDAQAAYAAITKAIELSPKKEQFFIERGIVAWDAGDVAKARDDFVTAYSLGPQFMELAAYAAAGNIAAGDAAAADKILMDAFGTTAVDSDTLAIAYYRAKNWPRLIALWKARADAPNASVETLFSLAAAYYAAGDKGNAIKTITGAIAKYPEATESGAAAIKQIEGK